MKELKTVPDTAIEVKANKDQENEFKYTGTMDIHAGQKLYSFNMETNAFKEVDLKDEKNYVYGTGANNEQIKKVYMQPQTIYVSAINEKNAKRKILAKFGFKWNIKKTTYKMDFTEIKEEPQIIELNKPEALQNAEEIKPDEETN